MSIEKCLPLAPLAAVDLTTVLAVAPLDRRIDRKYLVPVADAEALVRELVSSHRVLEICGRRSTTYRSTYFDTGDLRLCRDHLQGRRLRWKARSRLYVEDRLCRFEVKTKGRRGETVKHAVDLEADAYGRLGPHEMDFLAATLGADCRPPGLLRAVLEVGYSRATLVDLEHGSRLTLDHGVVGRRTPGARGLRDGAVAVDGDRIVVETKSGLRPGAGDRLLAGWGHRPVSLSKYATSAALLGTGISDNDARRLVGRGITLRIDGVREAS